MQDTLTRYINTLLLPERANKQLLTVLTPIFDQFSTRALTNSTLVANTATAKTGAADSYFVVQGISVLVAASTTMGTIAGTIKDGTVNVFCFFVDSAGVITYALGTAGATLGAMVFPPFPQGKCLIGYAQVTCSGGDFTGGSSGLATAGNFTVVFCSPVGPFNPTCLV
jgi:hypothetical protein